MTEPSFTGMKAVPDLLGKEIAGRYRITVKLGEGGMGAVYKAEQISLKRLCAVKLLRPEVAGTAIMLARFNAEAQAVAKLSHPNTVGIYDFGQDTDGTFFIAMEFVEGKSLREAIHTEAPFPIRRALAIASQVAASLTDAHSHSIVHRDLKPDNVMLQTRGRQRDVVRVLDFGIAKLRDEGRATQQAMTQAGDMLGTPQYMAPEQIRGEQIDGRTDIYALGCMLYEMVTGRMPFEGVTVMALLSKHLMETPPSPSQRRPELGIPPAIDHLVMTAMLKDPNARPATMEIFGEQIAGLLAQLPAETGQASAQVSAMVGPTLATAPGQSAGVPHGGFAPAVPPPGAPAPYITPGVMHPQTYPSPQGPPPGYPLQQASMTAPIASQPAGGGNGKLILIIVGVLVLVGGVGAFVATRKSSTPADAAVEAASDGGGDRPDKADAAEPPKRVDAAVKPTGDDDDGDDDSTPANGSSDPWATGSGAGDDAAMATEILTAMTDVRNQICACKDIACAGKAMASSQRWATALARHGAAIARLDQGTLTKIGTLQTEVATCASRIAAAPKPATDLNAQFEQLARRACGCVDEDCARKVLRDTTAFGRRNNAAKGLDEAKVKTSAIKMIACMKQAGLEETEILAGFQGADSP